MCRQGGFTLMEVLVTLVLLSILASVAMPYAEIAVRRDKELELRRSLREIRTAIDAFHRDWEQGLLAPLSSTASRDGYPVRLTTLTDGVRLTDGTTRKYLRKVPRDPFADATMPAERQWRLIGYRDAVDTSEWNKDDVYDVRSRSEQQAIDKSFHRNW